MIGVVRWSALISGCLRPVRCGVCAAAGLAVTTHYVFTDERILLQDGVFARERRDLPLDRVNDHVDRASRCWTGCSAAAR